MPTRRPGVIQTLYLINILLHTLLAPIYPKIVILAEETTDRVLSHYLFVFYPRADDSSCHSAVVISLGSLLTSLFLVVAMRFPVQIFWIEHEKRRLSIGATLS